MDIPAYLTAWVLYLLSATGLVLVFWRMTRSIKLRRTRRVLRSLAAVILFTPINISQQGLWLAPAYLVGAYDWVLGDYARSLQAAMYLSAAFTLLIVVILLESVLRRLLGMGRE